MKWLFWLLAGLCFLFSGCSGDETNSPSKFTLSERPASEQLLFDYTYTFQNIQESTHRYLATLKNIYGIEACIVTLENSPNQQSIQQLAATLLTNWNIGREHGGKGVLFLFIESDKEVKFEVSYELEDVFTDAFSGYIEDLQLRPNYRAGNLEIGIIAVFEEIEKRAELKKIGQYTRETIATSDAELLSGGAGASKKLTAYLETHAKTKTVIPPPIQASNNNASTPGQAFEIMLSKWAGKNSHPDIDIYTEATKMAMGDQNNPNDKRVTSQAKLLLNVPYTVKQDRDVALIHFNKKKGWEYAPYLFANDGSGWKFDIVSQRKFVVFGSKNSWHLERGDHPYNTLFKGFRSGLRKDIPFPDDVIYQIKNDRKIALKIRALDKEFSKNSSQDITIPLELGRLGVTTARRPKHVYAPLNLAKKISPANPESNKYLAVYHVMSNFQYESALEEIQAYNAKTNSVFGLNFLGFLHYKLQKYDKAADIFNESLKISPTVYAWCKLSRAEAMLYATSTKLDPRRSGQRQKAINAFNAARQMAPGNWRIPLLERWLKKKTIWPE